MKMIAFSVRDDEEKFFKEWSAQNNIQVDLIKDPLTDQTMNKIAGHDAILALQTGSFPASMFSRAKEKGIKVFSLRNVGVDNVDLKAATDNDIAVTNVPAYSPTAIAEFSVTLLLQLLRKVETFRKRSVNQDFRWAGNVGQEIHDKTVGVIGTGRIGKAAISIYRGFGAKILAYDPFPDPKLATEGIYVDTKEELYHRADIITLHMPASLKDKHMVDAQAISEMKDGVYLINTARGLLVDTKALIAGIRSGKVAGAGLDTYENESPLFNHDLRGKKIEDPLFNDLRSLENVLVTPHVAFYTDTAAQNMVQLSLNNAKSVIETGTSDSIVNVVQ